MEQVSRLEINLAAIEHNVAVVRRACSIDASGGPVALCGVLKADAYGLGAIRIARRLELAAIEMIAVFSPEQARRLIDAAITPPILILMPIRSITRGDPLYRAIVQNKLHFTVHSRPQLQQLAHHAERFGVTLPLHIEVNTGAGRSGARLDEASQLVADIAAHQRLRLAGLCTHFTCADTDNDFTFKQAQRFEDWRASLADSIPQSCVMHQAATAATFKSSKLHLNMVRVGLALFGYAQEQPRDDDSCGLLSCAEDLTPAMRWTSRIVNVSRLDKGDTVGYGATWRAERPTKLALIPTGYADGYPLALSNKGQVGVTLPDGQRAFAPVVGRVSMDQITVDVTDLPQESAEVGSPVELIGVDPAAPNHLPTMAKQAGTIAHDMLCGLSARLPRAYATSPQDDTAHDAGATATVTALHHESNEESNA